MWWKEFILKWISFLNFQNMRNQLFECRGSCWFDNLFAIERISSVNPLKCYHKQVCYSLRSPLLHWLLESLSDLDDGFLCQFTLCTSTWDGLLEMPLPFTAVFGMGYHGRKLWEWSSFVVWFYYYRMDKSSEDDHRIDSDRLSRPAISAGIDFLWPMLGLRMQILKLMIDPHTYTVVGEGNR